MGIDIYMRWKGMTEEEEQAQYTGYSTWSGHVGYLREAYHGGPYATMEFLPEAFQEDTPDEGVQIASVTLRERLGAIVELVVYRESHVYGKVFEDDPLKDRTIRSYIDFVELAERKETETGEPIRIVASY